MLRKFDESLLLLSQNGYGHAEEEEDNEDVDPMLGGRKSSVLRTLRAARESVREIYRPVTPIGAMGGVHTSAGKKIHALGHIYARKRLKNNETRS